MNRRILKLAIPNVISNITIPVIGMTDIALAGRLGVDSAIGAIAIATTIFGFIYWNCAFLRMGTSGLTAQAFGARNLGECTNLLVRSVAAALGMAMLLLIFQRPIGYLSMYVMDGSEQMMAMVAEYFYVRIWAAPATVSLYALQGWFIGMQNARTPMYVALTANVVNISVSIFLVFGLDMGIAGIAWGTVVTQYASLMIFIYVLLRYYRRFMKNICWCESLRVRLMARFFNVNKDIFLRNVCNVTVYTFFTVASSYLGEVVLSTNAILIQLFTFFSYMADGFANAAESLVGKFIGAGNARALKECVRKSFLWSTGIALTFMLIYRLFWKQILGVFTDSPEIIATAGQYIIWITLVPLIGFAPFVMDGIFAGATRTKILRNSMFVSTVIFFLLYFGLLPYLGNNALWLAFIVFLSSRGILQYFMSDKLKGFV